MDGSGMEVVLAGAEVDEVDEAELVGSEVEAPEVVASPSPSPSPSSSSSPSLSSDEAEPDSVGIGASETITVDLDVTSPFDDADKTNVLPPITTDISPSSSSSSSTTKSSTNTPLFSIPSASSLASFSSSFFSSTMGQHIPSSTCTASPQVPKRIHQSGGSVGVSGCWVGVGEVVRFHVEEGGGDGREGVAEEDGVEDGVEDADPVLVPAELAI